MEVVRLSLCFSYYFFVLSKMANPSFPILCSVQNLFDRQFAAMFVPQLRRLPSLAKRYCDELLAEAGVSHRKTRRIGCSVLMAIVFGVDVAPVDKASYALLAPVVQAKNRDLFFRVLRRCSVVCLFEKRPVIVSRDRYFFSFRFVFDSHKLYKFVA